MRQPPPAGGRLAKDTELIAIFVLLGLALLGGGAAAILDGLPYLVLERGFTQVIIGTIAATAGVILLALAWVLVEVRRVKAALSNAGMAMSVASLAGASQPQDAAPTPQGALPGAAEAAIGVGVGAGAVIAAAGAFEATTRQNAVPQETADPVGKEPDPLGDTTSGRADRDGKAAPDPLAVDITTLPVFDPFRAVAPQDDPAAIPTVIAEPPAASSDAPAAGAPETGEAADEVAAESDDESDTQADWLGEEADRDSSHIAEAASEPDADAPHFGEPQPEPEPESAEAKRGADEFSVLRESLAGRLRELDLVETRVEPSLGTVAEPDTGALQAAETWMEPASRRREPWFEAPAAAEPDRPAPDVAVPRWPPQSREASAVESEPESPADEPYGPEAETTAERDTPAPPAEAPAADDEAGVAEPQPEAPAATEPATSEEGIIGAYQVGDAHFTIYADGSIQARTPDGDYSFASMDELKVFLASEKSRLGV
jgi:hypothetical protein